MNLRDCIFAIEDADRVLNRYDREDIVDKLLLVTDAFGLLEEVALSQADGTGRAEDWASRYALWTEKVTT